MAVAGHTRVAPRSGLHLQSNTTVCATFLKVFKRNGIFVLSSGYDGVSVTARVVNV